MGIFEDVEELKTQMVAVQNNITSLQNGLSDLTRKSINANSDLNNLTEGYYYIADYDTCITISNRPVTTGQTATIDVLKAGNTGQLIMIYRGCIKECINMYVRVYYSNGWGDWLKLNDDTGWQTLTLNSGWSNPYGNDVAKYRKIGNVVYLRGLINGTSAAGNVIATLPEGYRPNGRYQRIICCKDQSNTVPIEITNEGTLSDYTKNTSTYREFVSLYGMCWVVD